jgi:exosortase/archaeosortase family protein
MDPGVHVEGTHIMGRVSLDFGLSCDAMDIYILFAAATVAFPSTWRRRAIGLVLGFASLVLLNVLRIVSLYFIGLRFPAKFELFHMQVWPVFIVVLASGAFLSWARTTTRPRRREVIV